MKKTLLILILIFSSNIYSNAQFSFGISIGGIGFHPKSDKNARFYKWKFDKKGLFVGFAGITFTGTYRINDYLGIKLQQTVLFHDCAGKPAGVTHLGLNFYDDIIGWNSNTDEMSFSFGPLWFYRKNWMQEPLYTNNPEFMKLSKNNVWERLFIWYGGQIEYAHNFNEKNAFTLNLFPGHPFLHTIVPGIATKL